MLDNPEVLGKAAYPTIAACLEDFSQSRKIAALNLLYYLNS